jgi:anti-sigma factor RsiW
MNCAEAKKYLDAFVDGELEAGLILGVESHVESCTTCAGHAGLRRRFKTELGALGARISAPASLRAKIGSLPERHRNRRWMAAAVTTPLAAAAALLLVLNVGRAKEETGGDPLSAVMNDVVARHVRDLPLEVRSADPAAATSWFQGKVDFPVRAPQLKLAGASFQGARLSNVQSQQAAHMAYTVDGHRVTLMIFPAEHLASIQGGKVVRAGGHDVLLGRHNGYNVAVTVDGDMAYAVSSDLPSQRLVSLLTDMSI